MRCNSAEQFGERLKRRYDRQRARRQVQLPQERQFLDVKRIAYATATYTRLSLTLLMWVRERDRVQWF